MRLRRLRTRGLTLTELLVVVLVMAILASPFFVAMHSVWNSDYTALTQNDLQKRARRSSDTVIDTIRPANGINIDSSGNAVAIPGGYTSATWVRLRYKDGSYVIYFLSGTNLQQTYVSGGTTTTTTITGDVQSLQFTYWLSSAGVYQSAASPSAAFVIQLDMTLAIGTYTSTVRSTVELRNKQ